MLGSEIADRLGQSYEGFLFEVVGVTADEEVAPTSGASEAAVSGNQCLERGAVSALGPTRQFFVPEVLDSDRAFTWFYRELAEAAFSTHVRRRGGGVQ